MLKVEAMKAMDMMSKDTKGMKKYTWDVINIKIKKILHYTLSFAMLCTIGDNKLFFFFNVFIWFSIIHHYLC
jgi:hypothetical protein